MRRLVPTLVIPVLALTLAGCSGGTEEESSTTATPQTTTQPAASSTAATGTESTAPATLAPMPTTATTTTSAPTTTPAPTTPAAQEKTVLAGIWVDDSWDVDQEGYDLCASGAMESPYALSGDDLYTCGSTSASALACSLRPHSESVTCITNALEKTAVRFRSPALAEGTDIYPREGDRMPFYVVLANGATCSLVAHDHDQHWNGRFSWYRCDDDSELLTKNDIDGTFHRGDVWTVERSVDKKRPQKTTVKKAVFADAGA